MATHGNLRVPYETLKADRISVDGISGLSEYAPSNQAHSALALQQLVAQLHEAELAEQRHLHEGDLIRDRVIAAGRALHEAVKVARLQVIAQFGTDSAAMHTIGLKRTSERKRPSRKRKAEAELEGL